MNKTEKEQKSENKVSIEELATFCKRKGFVYPSGEIYGGLGGFWDFGHLGTSLKKNFENVWRKYFLGLDDNFFEIETSEVMPENVFVASGHLKNFADLAMKCKKGHFEKANQLLEEKIGKKFEGITSEEVLKIIRDNKVKCSTCGADIESVRAINMMFSLSLGVEGTTKAFLRPETAQGPYTNFKNEFEVTRGKLPLGIALIGRAYRNEISPRNFLIRQRAFTQAELQIFFNPAKISEHEDFDSVKNYKLLVVLNDERGKGTKKIKCQDLVKRIPKFYVYYMAKVQQFYLEVLKFPEEKFRLYELNDKEKAFYNKNHFDIEVDIPGLGWTELGGIHYRSDHDLKGHQEISKQNLSVMDEEGTPKFIPHVLELSFGVDRQFVALMALAYEYDNKRDNIVLHLAPKFAPFKVAIVPLISKGKSLDLAREILGNLKEEFAVAFDKSGSIGKRYSRNDEIGTVVCITVDEESLKDKMVTLRDRETTLQVRVKISGLKDILRKVINEDKNIFDFGKKVNTRVK